jgi:hypothetical protein
MRTLSHARWRAALPTFIVLFAASAALVMSAGAAAAPAAPIHKCGSFTHYVPPMHGVPSTKYRIAVSERNVRCSTATGVIKAFWSGHGVVHHGGPSDAQSYWTLKRYPGWTCGQGAGGGGCKHGKQMAYYEVRVVA